MLAAFALGLGILLGDVTHVVAKGHTIETIAHRYHVSVKAIVDANHLKDPAHLKLGQTLVIPGVDPKGKPGKPDAKTAVAKGGTPAAKDAAGHATAHGATAALAPPPAPHGRAESETIHAFRLNEEFTIRTRDAHGHIPSNALPAFERMMRQGNATHPVDPRLVALVSIVSSHFGGKPLEVVSGYRAYTPTQYTPHSNHNLGRALDFRIRGVSNEALRDFCRTLRSSGCGYYPNSTFVHLDVRDTKAYWVDRSRPGEAPKYDSPDGGADEGTSDVPNEESAPPPPGANTPPPGAARAGETKEPAPEPQAVSPVATPEAK